MTLTLVRDGDPDEVGPRVVEGDGLPVVPGGDTEVRHPLTERAEVIGRRDEDVDLAETERSGPPAGTATVPGVHGEMVVVLAGAHEEGLARHLERGLETQPSDVELAGALDV